MGNSLPSNVRHITNYSYLLLYPVQSVLSLKKNTSFVSIDCCSWFLNVCVVIAAYHNHIIKGWWKLQHMLGGNYYSKDTNGCYLLLCTSCIYMFMLVLYVIQLLLLFYLVGLY